MRWGLFSGVLGLGAVALAGGAVYAWGAGWFWPCETIGIHFSGGACEKVATFEDRNVGSFLSLPNGHLLVATSAEGPDPATPMSLVEVDPANGATISDTPLPAFALKARTARMAVSGDGTQVALSMVDEKTTVVSRDGTPLASFNRWTPAFLAFDDKGWLWLDMGRNRNGFPEPDAAEAWAIADPGEEPVAANIADWSTLYRQGINTALSPDGTLYAQKIDQPYDSAITGIRVGYSGSETEPGIFLGLNLRADCSYATSEISFSPFGTQVAAEFSCPERWGQTSTALAVWDYDKRTTLLVLPGIDYFDTLLWQDANTILADRYNYGPQTTDILRISIPSEE